MKLENIDYISRLGNESVEQLIIMRFTTFLTKVRVLENIGNLAGTQIVIERDYLVDGGREIKECIQYLLGQEKERAQSFFRKRPAGSRWMCI